MDCVLAISVMFFDGFHTRVKVAFFFKARLIKSSFSLLLSRKADKSMLKTTERLSDAFKML